MDKTFFLAAMAMALAGCSSSDNDDVETIAFNESDQSFTTIFSDYLTSSPAEDNEDFYQLLGEYQPFPEEYDSEMSGWRLQGMNRSDDLFASIIGYVDGFEPEMDYDVSMSVSILTNVSSNCVGIGGAPGEAVYFKLGASTIKPANTVSDETSQGIYRPNIDKGNQIHSGLNALNVGDLANGIDCELPEEYVLKSMSTSDTIALRTDEQGGFWLIAGTDSGFEGFSDYFINKITVTVGDEQIEYDFNEGEYNFEPFFSDYPPSRDAVNNEEILQLQGSHRDLPETFSEEKAWYLSGLNLSEDLFLGLKGKASGYEANTDLNLRLRTRLLTNTPSDCDIDDIAPGETVFFKLGVSNEEPFGQANYDFERNAHYNSLTVDKGQAEDSGSDAKNVGNLENNGSCSDEPDWATKELELTDTMSVTTNSDGEFWILMGAETTVAKKTEFYILDVQIVDAEVITED